MTWFINLLSHESVAQALLAFSAVIAVGLAIGHIKVFGINLGVAGVLFAGLLLGHFGLHVNPEVLEFVREFGLILFVFAIGLQVGPGFIASFKARGLALNGLAVFVVLTGSLIAVAFHFWADVPLAATPGMLSGATTNTPSLGAAVEALKQIPGLTPADLKLPATAYAVAYPFGILGTILAMLLIRGLFRINVSDEVKALNSSLRAGTKAVSARVLLVENTNLHGVALGQIPGLIESHAVVSRLHRGGSSELARPETVLQAGDAVTVVAPLENAAAMERAIGRPAPADVTSHAGPLTTQRVVVTHERVLGKTPLALNFTNKYDVNITRVTRAGEDFTATGGLLLQFGDMLTLVGHEENVREAAAAVGNSAKELNHPRLAPLFVGIALGVLVGSIPLAMPGLPAPVKLGLAGGPLLIAMLLSRIGHLGPLVWYLPPSANALMREIGIALFLACVGLRAGDTFFDVLLNGDGLRWMMLAAVITIVPITLAGVFARRILKMNYVSICGLLAGSMTDPPALAFAHASSGSEGTSIAYATVYPLTMIMRVLTAQLIIILLAS